MTTPEPGPEDHVLPPEVPPVTDPHADGGTEPVDPPAADAEPAERQFPGMARAAGDLRAVRVVVADDHPIWRTGIRADLGENFHVVAEAGDAPSAIEAIRKERPELVLCDLHMPGGGGIKVAKECGKDVPVVMLTVSEQERDLLDAVAAGAVGYLVKSTRPDELRHALWRAAQGEPVFSPSLAALVLGEFRRMSKASSPVQALSDREREVLQLVARGHTYREIGEELYIAEKTVENHVRNILGKLHLSRKNELIRYALDHGID